VKTPNETQFRMMEAWNRRDPVWVTCTVCAKEYETFYPTKSLFCSNACRMKARKNIPAKCETCGKTFLRSAHSKARYCSRACSNARIDR